MGSCTILKKYARACTGILIAPLKRPRSLGLLQHKDDSARMAHFYDSLSGSVRNAFSHRISCPTQSDVDSRPRPLPCQSAVIRLDKNLQDREDCQNTRKSIQDSSHCGLEIFSGSDSRTLFPSHVRGQSNLSVYKLLFRELITSGGHSARRACALTAQASAQPHRACLPQLVAGSRRGLWPLP